MVLGNLVLYNGHHGGATAKGEKANFEKCEEQLNENHGGKLLGLTAQTGIGSAENDGGKNDKDGVDP